MKPTAGMQVTSNLVLVRELGRGGMGSVWVAEHSGLQSEVAVKFVRKSVADENPGMVERFRREAAIAARLKSPHVVTVFDHGLTDDGTPYIAMELLEGESLSERIQRQGPLAPEAVTLLVTQTCQVLEEAHDKGIVHRDIKPANLFLVDAGYELFVKVLDFGIAKTEAEHQVSVTSTGDILGSPLYMSPEQFTDPRDMDPRWDLWSLSVVAYKALTAQACFRGDSVGKVMMAVMTRDFDPPTVSVEHLPPALDAFFERAFAEEIEDRFASAGELADAFVQAIGDSVPSARLSAPGVASRRGATAATDDDAEAPTVTGASDDARAQTSGGTLSATTTSGPRPNRSSLRWLGVAAVLLGGGAAFTVLGADGTNTTVQAPAATGSQATQKDDIPPATEVAVPAEASSASAASPPPTVPSASSSKEAAAAPPSAKAAPVGPRPPAPRPPPPPPPPAPKAPAKDEGRAGRVLF